MLLGPAHARVKGTLAPAPRAGRGANYVATPSSIDKVGIRKRVFIKGRSICGPFSVRHFDAVELIIVRLVSVVSRRISKRRCIVARSVELRERRRALETDGTQDAHTATDTAEPKHGPSVSHHTCTASYGLFAHLQQHAQRHHREEHSKNEGNCATNATRVSVAVAFLLSSPHTAGRHAILTPPLSVFFFLFVATLRNGESVLSGRGVRERRHDGLKSRHRGPVTDILAQERDPAVALVSPAHADIIIQESHKFVIPSSAHAQGRTATNLWGVPDTAGTACALVQLSFVPGQQLFYYGARTWPAGVRKSMYDQFGGLPKDLEMEHDYDPKVTFVCMRERVALGLLVHFAASRRARLCGGTHRHLHALHGQLLTPCQRRFWTWPTLRSTGSQAVLIRHITAQQAFDRRRAPNLRSVMYIYCKHIEPVW